MPDFDRRSADLEIMDDLNCKGEVVDQTLRELEIINYWLGGNSVTLQGIERLLRDQRPSGTVTIADLGCGSGDMLKLISKWGTANKVPMRLIGFDANPNIIAYARARLGEHLEISFETVNILSDDFRKRKFDLVLATLFTHHFSEQELIEILTSIRSQAQIGVVINDIHRHWIAFYSIKLLTHWFSNSSMVKFDAPLSVVRAFRKKELESILTSAGIEKYSLRWKWAFRWQLIIPAESRPGRD